MGGVALIMFIVRFVFFTIFESPKFLMGKGRDEDAVRVVHEVARRNGKTSDLSIADLEVCNNLAVAGSTRPQQTTAGAAVKRNLQKIDASHIKALFATKKLACTSQYTADLRTPDTP